MWGIVANGLYGAFKPLFDPFGNLVAYLGFGGLGSSISTVLKIKKHSKDDV